MFAVGPAMCCAELSTLTPFIYRHRGQAAVPALSRLQKVVLMGNCMETCAHRQQQEKEEQSQPEKGEAGDFAGKEGGGCKVKILLTRKELEWLMLQLKEKGEQTLEDVLVEMSREMEKEKGKGNKGWKPSLECIVEIPEVQTFETLLSE